MRRWQAGCATILLLMAGCANKNENPPVAPYRAGAYYYQWFPDNFTHGTLRSYLDPPQSPTLGWYSSDSVAVAETHIALASRYGIDFFAVDYWPDRPWDTARIANVLLQAENIDDIRFALNFETWAYNYFPYRGVTEFNAEVTELFVAECVKIAENYFDHPSYLRIDERPVLFLYLSRTWFGEYGQAIAKAREALAQRGHNVYFVGDEIFWRVIASAGNEYGESFPTTIPQFDRMALFDAITAYNPYDSDQTQFAGYGGETTFLNETATLYQSNRDIGGNRVAVIPGVIPGYNDRGVRLLEDHYVIPRKLSESDEEGSFFNRALEVIGIPLIDPAVGLLMVTSFNEWNEDTAIEPVTLARSTVWDDSTNQRDYTNGYGYDGFGERYLAILQDSVVAVAGRVVNEGGAPVWREQVCGWQGKNMVVCDTTDRAGFYTLPRGLMEDERSYQIAPDGGNRIEVTIDPTATITGVDFVKP